MPDAIALVRFGFTMSLDSFHTRRDPGATPNMIRRMGNDGLHRREQIRCDRRGYRPGHGRRSAFSDEDWMTARAACGFDVTLLVSHHECRAERKIQFRRSAKQHSRRGLPAGTAVRGGVGAEVDGVDTATGCADALKHLGMDAVELFQRQELPPDIGLIRHHDRDRTDAVEECERFKGAWYEVEIGHAPDTGVETAVDDAVAIEKHA
jgi:hypothetical protein